jgi:hypothetical protein
MLLKIGRVVTGLRRGFKAGVMILFLISQRVGTKGEFA